MSLDGRALPQIPSTELNLSPLWNPLLPQLLSVPPARLPTSHTPIPTAPDLCACIFTGHCSLLNCAPPWLCHPAFFSTWSSFKYLHLHLQTLFMKRNLSLYFITACSRGKMKRSLKTSNLSKPPNLMRKRLWKWELLPQMLKQKCLFSTTYASLYISFTSHAGS